MRQQDLDLREVSRYLGYRGQALSPEVLALVEACRAELDKAVHPRQLSRRMETDRLTAASRDLAHHLRHCREGYLYAVTLGGETDRLLRRWTAQSMAKAAVGQAVCAVWLDQLCAQLCQELQASLGAGEYLTPPFSPGYGDWDLTAQGQVLAFLEAPKRMGLTLTAAGMLVPEKSITAVVGISDREEELCGQKCMRCQKKDCPFRAETT